VYAVRARLASGGFTLIEMLVVVAIIGIITGAVILSLSVTGKDPDLEKASDRLFTLLNYAHEQAELQTREYGVMFQDDGYEFLAFDARRGVWRSVFEDDALTARKLPDGLDVRLTVDGRPVVLTRPKDSKDKTPQVQIRSNGELSSFAITLERDGGLRSVTIAQDDKGEMLQRDMVEARP
jgi:general secretion pathway protein H